MIYETLLVQENDEIVKITFNRIEKQNAISSTFLTELNEALNIAERSPKCRFVVLMGQEGLFCTGMDLHEYLDLSTNRDKMLAWANLYTSTLKHFRSSSKIIVSAVNGKVIAGGTGLVAASDFAVASENSTFKLTEALWGLIPAMVAPYLMRRVGFQKGYLMALTSQTIKAKEALDIHLVDALYDNLDQMLDQLVQRMERVEGKSILELKAYFADWQISEKERSKAVEESVQRMMNPEVRNTIKNFVEQQQVPWKQ